MKIIPTRKREFLKYLVKLQKEIDPKFNRAKFLNYITQDDVLAMVSITTRGDGKTYSTLSLLLQLAVHFNDFKFICIARHFTLRMSYKDLLDSFCHDILKLKKESYFFDTEPDFIQLYIHNEPVCLITDLNNADDLKYYSGTLKYYKTILYDEFLALDDTYNPNELNQFRTIYQSINRDTDDHPQMFNVPKLILLGNPVNWSSPFLSFLGLYEMLEKQKMNTLEKHEHVVLERRKNMKSLSSVKLGLFQDKNDESYTGEFHVNTRLVPSPAMIDRCDKVIRIKINGNQFINCYYADSDDYYLEVLNINYQEYEYCLKLEDADKDVKYIIDRDYSHKMLRRFENLQVKFKNTYTMTFFDNMKEFQELDFNKLISKQIKPHKVSRLINEPVMAEKIKIDNIISKLNREYFI